MLGLSTVDSPVTTVLIVEDNEHVRRMLRKILKRRFDKILLAADPNEADRLLAENVVTHLLCDCNLGPGFPMGCQLIPGWRKKHPTIRRAVVYTGTDLSAVKVPPQVDRVVAKTDEVQELIKALWG